MQEVRRFVKYGAVGAVATALHYAILIGLVELLHRPAWQSALCGALIGAVVAYSLNHRFTFLSRQLHRVALPRFAAVALAGVALQTLVVGVGTTVFQWHYLVSQALATVLSYTLTFLINRQWTF